MFINPHNDIFLVEQEKCMQLFDSCPLIILASTIYSQGFDFKGMSSNLPESSRIKRTVFLSIPKLCLRHRILSVVCRFKKLHLCCPVALAISRRSSIFSVPMWLNVAECVQCFEISDHVVVKWERNLCPVQERMCEKERNLKLFYRSRTSELKQHSKESNVLIHIFHSD